MPTVLVIEDNRLNMELVSDLLEIAGYTVRQASTAEDGISIAQETHPDLILLDIGLPGIDGHTAVRLLKSDPRTRRIPAVAITAQAMKGDREAALEAGFDGYLTKPIDTATFSRVVSTYLADGDPA
jgi:two-component system cell cycle response regulator DivK